MIKSEEKHHESPLNIRLNKALNELIINESQKFPLEETLRIDLHCHDANSNVPDELLGRILNLPETWLSSEKLLEYLKKNGTTAVTITNHNNTQSCYELIKKGHDILVGAEYSCMVPDYNVGIHVLAYGFDKTQEEKLLSLRKNVYSFQEYARKENIPTVWAHPFYHYTTNKFEDISFFEKISLIFERFEIINGQRDTWQNMLIIEWLKTLNPDTIDNLSEKYKIEPRKYCKDPYKKYGTGGSDSHIGLFAGDSGTILHVPGLATKRFTHKLSELALDALRDGRVAAYGSFNNYEKLTVSFLDYVCQVAMYRKDPGLMRILLHKGTSQDKLQAFLISNAFSELQHHKITMQFIELFHKSFMGKKPNFTKRWFVPNVYKNIFDEAVKIAEINKRHSTDNVTQYRDAINKISYNFNQILCTRVQKKLIEIFKDFKNKPFDFNSLLNQIEVSSELRTLLSNKSKHKDKIKRISHFNLKDFLDGLSFPFLASSLILAAHFTSAKVLYNNRPVLNMLSEKIGKFTHRKRMLWLSDTYDDKNGVSVFLKLLHKYIVENDLPIDILVCSGTVKPDKNLIVVKPIIEFSLPFYNNQDFRVPDFLEIHHLFQQGEYDRIMCSTEGPMGLAALYLKNAFTVNTFFYVHTDWMTFGSKVLNIDKGNMNRFRRILRAYYKSFDKIFVLNTEQQKWFGERKMSIKNENILLTAHWAENIFKPSKPEKFRFHSVKDEDPVLLFCGRLSYEKGVDQLVSVYKECKEDIPNLKLVIAGQGPAEDELKSQLPDAVFLGWVPHNMLPVIYSSADLLLLPSQFDTFSFSVLEAFSCGLPVIAYNTKGPKDLIHHNINGFLVNNTEQMIAFVNYYFANPLLQSNYKKEAIKRAAEYTSEKIMTQLLKDVNLA